MKGQEAEIPQIVSGIISTSTSLVSRIEQFQELLLRLPHHISSRRQRGACANHKIFHSNDIFKDQRNEQWMGLTHCGLDLGQDCIYLFIVLFLYLPSLRVLGLYAPTLISHLIQGVPGGKASS